LEDLIKKIKENANLKIQQIKEKGTLKAEEIKKKIKEEIELEKIAVEKKVKEKLSIEQAKTIGNIEKSFRSQENSYKCLLISKTKEDLIKQFESFRKKNAEDYKNILKNLIEEALKEIKDKFLVKASSRDKDFCRKYLQGKNISFQLLEDNDIKFGVVICDLENKVEVYNTFESRWKILYPHIRRTVAKLWQEEESL